MASCDKLRNITVHLFLFNVDNKEAIYRATQPQIIEHACDQIHHLALGRSFHIIGASLQTTALFSIRLFEHVCVRVIYTTVNVVQYFTHIDTTVFKHLA